MFRRNKTLPAPTTPEANPVTPVSEEAETVDIFAERLALTKHLGELVHSSTVAFNRELQLARERGLSLEDQEAYMKSLWAQCKIPRILAKGYRSHTTGLRVVRPDRVDEIKIFDLEQFDPTRPRDESPYVDRDSDRVPNPENPEDEPIIFLDDLPGYFNGKVNAGAMDSGFSPLVVPAEAYASLQSMAVVLEEASVVDVTLAQ